MSLEPVKIPQNVYVEDRIVGPLTLKQLIICGVGGGFSYMLYSAAAKYGVVNIPLTIILWSPAVIAAAFAFLRINDLSLFNIILLFIEHLNKPAVRTWVPHPGISINIVTRAPKAEKSEDVSRQDVDMQKLAELSRQMQQREEQLKSLTSLSNAANSEASLSRSRDSARLPDGQGIAAAGAESPEHETRSPMPEEETISPASTTLPVNPGRIRTSGSGPSVDGLSSELGAYTHLFPEHS